METCAEKTSDTNFLSIVRSEDVACPPPPSKKAGRPKKSSEAPTACTELYQPLQPKLKALASMPANVASLYSATRLAPSPYAVFCEAIAEERRYAAAISGAAADAGKAQPPALRDEEILERVAARLGNNGAANSSGSAGENKAPFIAAAANLSLKSALAQQLGPVTCSLVNFVNLLPPPGSPRYTYVPAMHDHNTDVTIKLAAWQLAENEPTSLFGRSMVARGALLPSEDHSTKAGSSSSSATAETAWRRALEVRSRAVREGWSATHTSMAGGTYCWATPSDKRALAEAIAADWLMGIKHSLSELRGPIFIPFMDIELMQWGPVPPRAWEEAVRDVIQPLMRRFYAPRDGETPEAYSDRLRVRVLLCDYAAVPSAKLTKPSGGGGGGGKTSAQAGAKRKRTNGTDATADAAAAVPPFVIKSGAHLTWPNLRWDSRRALLFVSAVRRELQNTYGPRVPPTANPWSDAVDSFPYKVGGSLRMLLTFKAKPCSACKDKPVARAKCYECDGYGKFNAGRRYMPAFQMGGDGARLAAREEADALALYGDPSRHIMPSHARIADIILDASIQLPERDERSGKLIVNQLPTDDGWYVPPEYAGNRATDRGVRYEDPLEAENSRLEAASVSGGDKSLPRASPEYGSSSRSSHYTSGTFAGASVGGEVHFDTDATASQRALLTQAIRASHPAFASVDLTKVVAGKPRQAGIGGSSSSKTGTSEARSSESHIVAFRANSHSHWCTAVGREHTSNHVYFMVTRHGIRQKCYKCVDFRQEKPFPLSEAQRLALFPHTASMAAPRAPPPESPVSSRGSLSVDSTAHGRSQSVRSVAGASTDARTTLSFSRPGGAAPLSARTADNPSPPASTVSGAAGSVHRHMPPPSVDFAKHRIRDDETGRVVGNMLPILRPPHEMAAWVMKPENLAKLEQDEAAAERALNGYHTQAVCDQCAAWVEERDSGNAAGMRCAPCFLLRSDDSAALAHENDAVAAATLAAARRAATDPAIMATLASTANASSMSSYSLGPLHGIATKGSVQKDSRASSTIMPVPGATGEADAPVSSQTDTSDAACLLPLAERYSCPPSPTRTATTTSRTLSITRSPLRPVLGGYDVNLDAASHARMQSAANARFVAERAQKRQRESAAAARQPDMEATWGAAHAATRDVLSLINAAGLIWSSLPPSGRPDFTDIVSEHGLPGLARWFRTEVAKLTAEVSHVRAAAEVASERSATATRSN